MNLGTVVVAAGLSGLLSFAFLAVAIGSEYWYIIEVDTANNSNHSEEQSSHSGLWTISEGKDGSSHPISPFSKDTANITEQEKHLLNLYKVITVLLPLSLVMLVFGGICGLVSSLAQSCTLLTGAASFFLVCSLLTLSGVSIYIRYCHQALEYLQLQWRLYGVDDLSHVHTSFGWSLALAWLSFCLEAASGILLMLAARMAHLQGHGETSAVI